MDLETIKTFITFGTLLLSIYIALSNHKLQTKFDIYKNRFSRIQEIQFNEVMGFWKQLIYSERELSQLYQKFKQSNQSNSEESTEILSTEQREIIFLLLEKSRYFIDDSYGFLGYIFFIPEKIRVEFEKLIENRKAFLDKLSKKFEIYQAMKDNKNGVLSVDSVNAYNEILAIWEVFQEIQSDYIESISLELFELFRID